MKSPKLLAVAVLSLAITCLSPVFAQARAICLKLDGYADTWTLNIEQLSGTIWQVTGYDASYVTAGGCTPMALDGGGFVCAKKGDLRKDPPVEPYKHFIFTMNGALPQHGMYASYAVDLNLITMTGLVDITFYNCQDGKPCATYCDLPFTALKNCKLGYPCDGIDNHEQQVTGAACLSYQPPIN